MWNTTEAYDQAHRIEVQQMIYVRIVFEGYQVMFVKINTCNMFTRHK